jgi:hypothetical protein
LDLRVFIRCTLRFFVFAPTFLEGREHVNLALNPRGLEDHKARSRLAAAPCLKRSRRRPTLPPRLQGSTIGAEGLNYWVRNGTRCITFAITTGNL